MEHTHDKNPEFDIEWYDARKSKSRDKERWLKQLLSFVRSIYALSRSHKGTKQ